MWNIKNVLMITDALEKESSKLRQKWMKINKHLSSQYKTGKFILRLSRK